MPAGPIPIRYIKRRRMRREGPAKPCNCNWMCVTNASPPPPPPLKRPPRATEQASMLMCHPRRDHRVPPSKIPPRASCSPTHARPLQGHRPADMFGPNLVSNSKKQRLARTTSGPKSPGPLRTEPHRNQPSRIGRLGHPCGPPAAERTPRGSCVPAVWRRRRSHAARSLRADPAWGQTAQVAPRGCGHNNPTGLRSSREANKQAREGKHARRHTHTHTETDTATQARGHGRYAIYACGNRGHNGTMQGAAVAARSRSLSRRRRYPSSNRRGCRCQARAVPGGPLSV